MKIKKKPKETTKNSTSKVDKGLLVEIENSITLKNEQLARLKAEILDLYDRYAREKYKKLKEGHIYTYDNNGKILRGVLKFHIDKDMPESYPLRLQIINKDGRLGNSMRIVYDVKLLKYEGNVK